MTRAQPFANTDVSNIHSKRRRAGFEFQQKKKSSKTMKNFRRKVITDIKLQIREKEKNINKKDRYIITITNDIDIFSDLTFALLV